MTKSASMTVMPDKPKTRISSFRIPAELKSAAAAKAESEGKTLTDVIVEALTRYVKRSKS